jgi:hypothetical protein
LFLLISSNLDEKGRRGKTSFITPFGSYGFVRMPKGLKNASQSFSRMSLVVLVPQLRRNVVAYIDDIVVTSAERQNHVVNLAETFANLRVVNLSLNPEKCIFRVHKGKVLGAWSPPRSSKPTQVK